MENDFNYNDEMFIDDSALDVEWLNQPELMRKMTKRQAKAQERYELAEENVSYVYATLDKEIRDDPDKFDIDKITEPAVRSAILINEKYTEAKKNAIRLKFQYNTYKGMVEACGHRKEALVNMVKLFLGGYFAGPSIPRDLVQEVKSFKDRKAQQQQTNQTVSQRLNKNK